MVRIEVLDGPAVGWQIEQMGRIAPLPVIYLLPDDRFSGQSRSFLRVTSSWVEDGATVYELDEVEQKLDALVAYYREADK